MPDTPAVSVNHLTKVFKSTLVKGAFRAVHDLSLTVKAGEVYGLIGPNGSGKSTTMKVILGLLKPTEGDTSIFGIPSTEVASRSDVGFLPENPYFYKHLTGRETLHFYGSLCGMRGAKLKERAAEMLALTGLEDAATRRVGGYSKGMLQRLGLAQALIHEPRLLVLDEPTAGVDPAGSRKIRDLIIEFRSRGITVLVTSHLLEQMQEVCDRVGILQRGRLVHVETMESLRRERVVWARLAAPLDHWPELPGAKPVTELGREIAFEQTGPPGPLFAWLGTQAVEEIRVEPSGLHPIYLKYHGNGA